MTNVKETGSDDLLSGLGGSETAPWSMFSFNLISLLVQFQ